MTPDGQRVIVPTMDSLRTLDALTGTEISTVRVARWPYYACWFIGLALAAWILLWIRAADRAGVPRVMTMLVVTCLVLTTAGMRLHLSGRPEEPHRIAAMVFLAVFIAWSAELMQHLLRPGVSLLSRTCWTSLYLVAFYFCSTQVWNSGHDGVLVLSVFSLYFAMFYGVLRWLKRLKPVNTPASARSQFSLRSILVITTAFAIAASYFYQNPRQILTDLDPVRNAQSAGLIGGITLWHWARGIVYGFA